MYNFLDLEQSSLQIRIKEPHLASLSPLFPHCCEEHGQLGWSSMYAVKQNYNLDRDLWSRIKMEGNKYCHLLHYVERGQIRRGSGAEKLESQGLESKRRGHAGVTTHISGRY